MPTDSKDFIVTVAHQMAEVSLNSILYKIRTVSEQEEWSLEIKALKLGEELGEFNQAILYKLGKKGTKMSDKEVEQNAKEELVDILQVALDIMQDKYKMTASEIEALMIEKCNKWEKKMVKNRTDKKQ